VSFYITFTSFIGNFLANIISLYVYFPFYSQKHYYFITNVVKVQKVDNVVVFYFITPKSGDFGERGKIVYIIFRTTRKDSRGSGKIEKIVYIIFRTTRKDSRGSGGRDSRGSGGR
jgi:hypothetical protein